MRAHATRRTAQRARGTSPAAEPFPRGGTPPDRDGYPDYSAIAAADRGARAAYARLLVERMAARAARVASPRWPARARALRRELARLLGLRLVARGPKPPCVALERSHWLTEPHGAPGRCSLARLRVVGAGWDGEDVGLLLARPLLAAPRGAVLLLPDAGGALVGAQSAEAAFAAWGVALTEAGFVVAIADLPALRALSPATQRRRVLEGACALGAVIGEAAAALDALVARGEAGGRAPWLAGIGFGASAAIALAALDGRAAGVLADAPARIGGVVEEPYAAAVPGINRVTDLEEVAATIAPRPLALVRRPSPTPSPLAPRPVAVDAFVGAIARAWRGGGRRCAALPPDAAVAWLVSHGAPRRTPRAATPRRAPTAEARPATTARGLAAWRRAATALRRSFLDLVEVPAATRDCTPLGQRVLGVVRRDGCTRWEIDIRTGPHAIAKLAFLRPDGAPRRRPTILCLPGSGSDVAQVEREYAREVVARGWNAAIVDARVALHPFLPGIAERRPGLGQSLHDLRVALTAVAARDDVDPARIGTFGVSQGGTHAWLLAAVDERVAAAAPVCGHATWRGLIDARLVEGASRLDGHSPYYYFPGMLALGDQPDLAALVAPRPMIAIGASDDFWFPLDGMRAFARAVRRVYRLHGRASAFRYVEFVGEHSLPLAARRRAYAFFARVFAVRS